MVRRYSELRRLDTLEDRYKYLALRGSVGESTFGFDRYINQRFYGSTQWRQLRTKIVLRDGGCDLGVPEYEISERIYIHHMNPMTVADIEEGNPDILNPEFLISASLLTHNAIHYGDMTLLPKKLVERKPGDTRLW